MPSGPPVDLSFIKPDNEPELKREFSCATFSAEHVRILGTEAFDYSYKGGSHYLALHDIVRSDGESFVEGAQRHCDRDIRKKMTLVPANCTVSGWTAPTRRHNTFTALYFDPEAMATQLDDNDPRQDFAPVVYFEDAALLSTLSKIEGLLRRDGPPDRIYAETLGLLAAIELYRVRNAGPLAPAFVPGGLSQPQLRRVIEFIRTRLDEDLSLTHLASLVGMSQFHFARLFKVSTGETPHQYVLSLRVERARDLLKKAEMPISEVARASGFNGAVQFSRAFLKMAGMTPSEYRKSL